MSRFTKEERLQAALADLQAQIDKGAEYPDASADCAIAHRVPIAALTEAYDAACGRRVWIFEDTSREFGHAEARVFSSRPPAIRAARKAIEACRRYHSVSSQIDNVLQEFDAEVAGGGYQVGAGDSGALFYVRVHVGEVER